MKMKHRVNGLIFGILILVLAVGVVFTTTTSAVTAPVTVNYIIANDWGNGCQYNIVVRNITSTPILGGWKLSWTFIGNQKMIYPTPPIGIQSGSDVTYIAPTYLTIPPGGTVNIGISVSGTGRGLTNIKFNGIPVGGLIW